jgi:hypothetical protein
MCGLFESLPAALPAAACAAPPAVAAAAAAATAPAPSAVPAPAPETVPARGVATNFQKSVYFLHKVYFLIKPLYRGLVSLYKVNT